MKNDAKWLSSLDKKYSKAFNSGDLQYRSFHDLLWQIAINGMLDDEKEPVVFTVNVRGDFGNELVLAYSSGGYKSTGVYFISNNYSDCYDLSEEINSYFFQIDKKEQMQLISKSMRL